MQYKAVIFDFDYTLGDATEGIVSSVNFALQNMGYGKAPREEIRKTVGLSLAETCGVLTGNGEKEQGELFLKYFKEQADRVMVEHTELFPDTVETLKYLKSSGIPMAIVTTKYHYRIDDILEKCQAQDYFEIIVGGEDVKAPKPDPEGVQIVLEKWKMKNTEVLYVGDSVVDAKTAQRAGVSFAGVTTGTTGSEALKEYGCAGVFENLTQLRETLL